MATFRNRHGKWHARVQRKGQQPVSKSFQSKEDAQRWANLLSKYAKPDPINLEELTLSIDKAHDLNNSYMVWL